MGWGFLLSLLPTFYPSEAEKRGATPSQYGFVFGIVNLAAFLFAPIFARFGTKMGPRSLHITGAFIQAFAGLAFGFLVYIETSGPFLGLSYFLRHVYYFSILDLESFIMEPLDYEPLDLEYLDPKSLDPKPLFLEPLDPKPLEPLKVEPYL